MTVRTGQRPKQGRTSPKPRRTLLVASTLIAASAGCQGAPEEPRALRTRKEPTARAEIDCPAPALPAFCARPGDDVVRDIFCTSSAPRITKLSDLQGRLGIAYDAEGATTLSAPFPPDDHVIYDHVVFLGHSTSLGGRVVSPINPRAIFFADEAVLAFQRGLQQVELAASDRADGDINLYLVRFEQPCSTRAGGCVPGDLYTPSIETSWTRVTIEDDEDLKNGPQDCRQCHRRGRERTELLMRELISPWTHFFEGDAPGGSALPGVRGGDLVRDYLRARGDEPYAGASAEVLRHTSAVFLQNIVTPQQPVFFDAPTIEDERWLLEDGGYARTPRRSATWDRAYEGFKRGEQLAPPHFEARPTDPQKQAALTEAYQRYRAGALAPTQLPDLSDVFPDDPRTRAEIGLDIEPGAAPADALIQACGSCHNDVLDQSISRARFSVDLTRMSRAALDLAITRVSLPPEAEGAMPPPEARQLDQAARTALVAYLQQATRAREDELRLARAATLGMAGGDRP